MRLIFALAATLLLVGCGRAAANAEANMAQPAPPRSPEALSLGRITPREPGSTLELTSTAVGADGAIDLNHTSFGNNLSPPLHWTEIPHAVAYAIILEDPDAPRETPFVHWLIWNIPGQATALPEGLPAEPNLMTPQGTIQGRNDNGSFGYFGPRPPPGTGLHHYHFQIFALDSALMLDPHADIRALVQAMQGHVLADGEMVATFAAPNPQ